MNLRKLEGDVHPLLISGLFVLLLLIMIVPIVLFSGELTELISGGKTTSHDYCKNNISLNYGVICKEGSKLKLNIENNGDIVIKEFLFKVEEDSGSYLTRGISDLNLGASLNYSIDYHVSDEVNRILITPTISVDGELIACSVNNYEVGSLRSCLPDYGSDDDGDDDDDGGSSSNGNGGDDGPSCSDSDGDGYGANCASGSDCDDSNPEIWYDQDFYLDEDHDLYGVGDVIHTECWGEGGVYVYPMDEMAFNNEDCDDSDNIRWQLYDVYMDSDRDGYGFGDLIELCSGTALTFSIDVSTNHLSINDEDCNDGNSDVNPGETEDCSDGFDNDCDNDLCVDCSVESEVLSTGCRCEEEVYYAGYCCKKGFSAKPCSDPIPNSPLRNFFSGLLDYLFST